jgi:hypothetical protein
MVIRIPVSDWTNSFEGFLTYLSEKKALRFADPPKD